MPAVSSRWKGCRVVLLAELHTCDLLRGDFGGADGIEFLLAYVEVLEVKLLGHRVYLLLFR